jgi:molybdate transport system permease protein
VRRRGADVPWVLWIPAAVALALVVLPVVGLLVRTDLTRFPSLVTSPASLHALQLSIVTAGLSTVACVLLGVPLAVVLARSRLRGIRVLRAVVLLPLVLPPVLSFARALGEFGATITFAGSLEGVTRTLPLEVYTQAEVNVDSAVALALLLIVVAILVIALARPRALEGART